MATGDLHLSIHLGDRWTAAVTTSGGRTGPVTFDGQTRIPSGVYTDPHSGAVIPAAAALARHDREPGRFVLICTISDDYPTLTVLDTTDQYTQLAATTVRDPDTPGIHHALAALLRQRSGAHDPAAAELDWRTADEIDRARTALTTQPRTPILLPEQSDPVVLDLADLGKAVQPHLDQLGAALTQTLTDADIDHADVTATVLIAYDATAPLAQTALTDAGLPPLTTISQPDLLAVGAAQLTAGHAGPGSGPTAATTRLPRTRLTLASLTAVAVLAVASVALLTQTITTADISTIAVTVVGVRLPVENLTLAAALAATAATAAAQLAPTTWLSPKGMADPASTGLLLRRSYLAAAAAGLALAGLWGLGVGVAVEYPANEYVRWALTAALPIAGCAAIIALVSPRIPAPRLATWIPRMRPPVWPIAAAAAGVYLTRSAFTLTFPTNLTGYYGIIAAIGGAALGAGTAATVTRQPWIRAATGAVLVPGYALVVTVNTITYLATAYVAALIWWHLAATASTLHDAIPDSPGMIRRWIGRY
jgi:hypothetical protein